MKLSYQVWLNCFLSSVSLIDQGTAETSYLCKSCFHEQTNARKQQQSELSNFTEKSRFYSIVPPPQALPTNYRFREATERGQYIIQQPMPSEAATSGLGVATSGQLFPVNSCVNKQLTSPSTVLLQPTQPHQHQPARSPPSPLPPPLLQTGSSQLLPLTDSEVHQLTSAGSSKQLADIRPVVMPPPVMATVGHIVPVAAAPYPPPPAPMRVKLPSPTGTLAVSPSHPCKTTSCEFYGTPELDYFCSKCSKNNVRSERWW